MFRRSMRRWCCISSLATLAACGAASPPKPGATPPAPAATVAVPPPSPPDEPDPAPAVSDAPPAVYDLPHASELDTDGVTFVVSITRDGDVLVAAKPVKDDAELFAVAQRIAARDPDAPAVIAADQSVRYARVVEVLDVLRRAGFRKLSLAVASDP